MAKKKKAVYPGVDIFSTSAYVTLGKGLVGTMVTADNKLYLMSLIKPVRVGSSWKDENLGEETVVIEFDNLKGLDILIESLKEIKKSMGKKR